MRKKIFIKTGDFDVSESYNLFFELNDGFYNYAVVDSKSNSLKELGSSDISLSDKSNILFRHDFSKIYVSIITKSFSFVPEILSEGTDISLPRFLNTDFDEVTYTGYLEKDIKNVFNLKKELVSFFDESFNNSVLFPQMLSFYKGNKKTNGFFANVKGGHLELLVIENGQLLFYNIFEYSNDNELQYFLMLVAQQKGINPTLVSLKISGEIAEDSLTYQRIKTLFPNIGLNIPDVELDIPDDFSGINLHRYFSLLNLYICE